MISSRTIMNLDFDFYRTIFHSYWDIGLKGLGPSDEFINVYCMGGEL